MEYSKIIEKSINKKVIRPINFALKHYSNKLIVDKSTKHPETVYLLKQSYRTITNSEKLLRSSYIVDSNVLLRSSFEYLMMGINIQFNDNTYKELINLSLKEKDRDDSKPSRLISEYRKHMNKLSEELFKDINRKDKEDMLNELYNKLCCFTHGSLIVSSISRIDNYNVKNIFMMLCSINIYIVKLFLYLSFKYFIKDNRYQIELNNLYFSYLFKTINIIELINKNKEKLEEFNNYLYTDNNLEYVNNNIKDMNEIKNVIDDNNKYINDNQDEFINDLKEFLS